MSLVKRTAALRTSALLALGCLSPLLIAQPAPGERLSFVSCPIVRDTSSVPCWLSAYEGHTYYLTIQSDVSAEVQPPMLGHQVLVEGIVSDKPAICGGIPLEQVRLSVLPERDANCNEMLPAEERYTIDFNPRPPGPSGGRLAFDPSPPAAGDTGSAPPPAGIVSVPSSVATTDPDSGAQSIDLHFDLEKGVSFRHPGPLLAILDLAAQLQPQRIRITGVRGAHLLSDGSLLRESESVGRRRAEEVAALLQGAGLTAETSIEWTDGLDEADGVDDWRTRRVTVVLEP